MDDSQTIAAGLSRVAARLGDGPITGLKRLSGGASQETWAFDVATAGYILRRAPGGVEVIASSQAIGLPAEAAVIKAAVRAGVPAPAVVTVCTPEDGLGPGYVMERLRGETIARKILRDPGFDQARGLLAGQSGTALAKIHAVRAAAVDALPTSDAGEQLDRYEELYRSFGIDRPCFELGFAALRRRLPPPPATTCLVHGDFRLGNLMVGPEGLVAALDWELAHRGDPAEDLGWMCVPSWRFGQLDRPAGGFGRLEDLLEGYHSAGGDRAVDAARVRFWTLFGSLKWGVMCLMMYRAFESGLDRSVERAAIGRRASETELDVILMLKEWL